MTWSVNFITRIPFPHVAPSVSSMPLNALLSHHGVSHLTTTTTWISRGDTMMSLATIWPYHNPSRSKLVFAVSRSGNSSCCQSILRLKHYRKSKNRGTNYRRVFLSVTEFKYNDFTLHCGVKRFLFHFVPHIMYSHCLFRMFSLFVFCVSFCGLVSADKMKLTVLPTWVFSNLPTYWLCSPSFMSC